MLITKIDTDEFLNMKEDDIRELFCEDTVNKQELREIIYRLRRRAISYRDHSNYLEKVNQELEEKIETIKDFTNKF